MRTSGFFCAISESKNNIHILEIQFSTLKKLVATFLMHIYFTHVLRYCDNLAI
jgi:hypothetical protein